MLQCDCYTVAAVSDRHLICVQRTRFARTVWVMPKYLHKHKHSSRRADDIRTYRIAALIKFILIYNLYRYLSAFDDCPYNLAIA